MNKEVKLECCPEFDPKPLDGEMFEWENKKFIKDKVITFFYFPLNFGKIIRKLNKKIENVNAICPQWLCLSKHISKWKMILYLAVDKEIPDTENVFFPVDISAKFMRANSAKQVNG